MLKYLNVFMEQNKLIWLGNFVVGWNGLYSRNHPNMGGPGHNFLNFLSKIFRFVTLPLKIQRKLALFGYAKVKNQDPWKFHEFFLSTSGNSNSLEIPTNVKHQDPWKFHMSFSWTGPLDKLYRKTVPLPKNTISNLPEYENYLIEIPVQYDMPWQAIWETSI